MLAPALGEAHCIPSESLLDGAWSKGSHALALSMIASLKHAEVLSLGPAALAGKAAEFNAEKTFDDLFAIFVDNAGDLPGRKALAGLMQEARTAETLALFSPPRGQKVPPKFGEADAEGGEGL